MPNAKRDRESWAFGDNGASVNSSSTADTSLRQGHQQDTEGPGTDGDSPHFMLNLAVKLEFLLKTKLIAINIIRLESVQG